MISMTGFACIEKTEGNSPAGEISLTVEIRGYNNRFLEVQVNAPVWLSRFEPKIREIIGGVCGRGKVEVYLRVKELNAPVNVRVNVNAAKAYADAIFDLAAGLPSVFNTEEKLSLSTLIGMEGVLEVEKVRDDEKYWAVIEPALREAAGVFQAERVREGKHTEEDILNSVSRIESALQTVMSRVGEMEDSIKENIKNRFRDIIGEGVDDNRILAETAVQLMKYTVAEEVSRLSSHLAEFRSETAKNDRPGKKLDFLSQEINREINTIGSKSTIIEVSRAVVEMKEALENIREQLRNVE
jgi:uncharacterized protein (TIGR00255 family)